MNPQSTFSSQKPDQRRNAPTPFATQHSRVRHSFSGVPDDLIQNTQSILSGSRFGDGPNSMEDLEERLRNIGIIFHEPFILNNSRC